MRAYGENEQGQMFTFVTRKSPSAYSDMTNAYIREINSEYATIRLLDQRSFRYSGQAEEWLREEWRRLNLRTIPSQF